jgi:hypothetical protein
MHSPNTGRKLAILQYEVDFGDYRSLSDKSGKRTNLDIDKTKTENREQGKKKKYDIFFGLWWLLFRFSYI